MTRQKVFLMIVLMIVLTVMFSSIAYGEFSIRIEKDLPMSEVTVPTTLTLNIYDANTYTLVATPEAHECFLRKNLYSFNLIKKHAYMI